MSGQESNVIDLFSGKPVNEPQQHRIIRIAPELDGLEILYTNESSDGRLFSIKVLCWALLDNGVVVGMLPWLNRLMPCIDLKDPMNGHWEGYFDPLTEEVFFDPPRHKIVELESANHFYHIESDDPDLVLQEIPDVIGTHAVLTIDGFQSFYMQEVTSWRLLNDGEILGMLADQDEVTTTPVLPGDPCLYPAQSHPDFRYFFQHRIANKIKAKDPEALAAMSLLMETKNKKNSKP